MAHLAPCYHDCVLILHADHALLVIDKPAGLLAVPGRGADKQDCAWSRVRDICPDALVVHRLDMATSGLMLLARGADAQRTLSMAFAARAVEKTYIADVHGEPPGPTDHWQVIDLPLIVDWPNRPRSKVDRAIGKPSVTRWRALSFNALRNTTRLELMPLTGRSHQLRVHLAAIGHPIVGDPLYGTPDGAARMHLHAAALTVPHPTDGKPAAFASPPPF